MKNLLLDAILLALFVAELSFNYLPEILHEILGVLMAVLIVVHVGTNWRRFISPFKNMNPKKFFFLEVNLALILGTLIILTSGVCMSNYLFPDAASPELRRNMTIHNLHTSTPYIMMILIGIHLGIHWDELWQRFFKRFGAKKFFIATAIILSAIGVAGMFLNRFLDRILMKHIFATPATDLPVWIFILLMLGGVTAFALPTYLIVKKFFKR